MKILNQIINDYIITREDTYIQPDQIKGELISLFIQRFDNQKIFCKDFKTFLQDYYPAVYVMLWQDLELADNLSTNDMLDAIALNLYLSFVTKVENEDN